MGPLVVVVPNPEPDSFPGGVEAFELRSGEKLLPDAFPEPLDLAEGHRMVWAGFEVVGAIFLHLRLKAGEATPVHILPAVVSEHLFGRLILGCGHTKDFQYILGGVAAEQVGTHHET